jgi:hypothetical protein
MFLWRMRRRCQREVLVDVKFKKRRRRRIVERMGKVAQSVLGLLVRRGVALRVVVLAAVRRVVAAAAVKAAGQGAGIAPGIQSLEVEEKVEADATNAVDPILPPRRTVVVLEAAAAAHLPNPNKANLVIVKSYPKLLLRMTNLWRLMLPKWITIPKLMNYQWMQMTCVRLRTLRKLYKAIIITMIPTQILTTWGLNHLINPIKATPLHPKTHHPTKPMDPHSYPEKEKPWPPTCNKTCVFPGEEKLATPLKKLITTKSPAMSCRVVGTLV